MRMIHDAGLEGFVVKFVLIGGVLIVVLLFTFKVAVLIFKYAAFKIAAFKLWLLGGTAAADTWSVIWQVVKGAVFGQ